MAKLKPGDKIGPFPYQIVKQLGKGQGNMSDVYLATEGDRPDGPLVVLKISRADSDHGAFFTDTIYNEAERLRQLSHPGIVRLLPIKTNSAAMRAVPYVANASLPGRPWFLVLEHLAGGALDDILSKEKRLPELLALRIAQRLAATLDYIHRCNQVHLDIKPENILFRRALEPDTLPDPVLIDFGIARNVGQEGLEARTLHYSPPERVLLHKSSLPLEALAKPAPSMDVYSLGVVLYQMLAGRRPFEGQNDKRISSAILNNDPTKPSVYAAGLDPEVEELVLQAMAKDPTARPTAGELAQRLEAIAVRRSYSAPDPTPKPGAKANQKQNPKPNQKPNQKLEPSHKSRPGLLLAGGVTLAGLALVGALFAAGGLLPGLPITNAAPGGAGPAVAGISLSGLWEQVTRFLPGGAAGEQEGGDAPAVAWVTATATDEAAPTAVGPTSTPVPDRPTATSTLAPTSTPAVRNTATPTPAPTATATPAPAADEPSLAAAAAATTAATPAPTATAKATATAQATATPSPLPPTSTPLQRPEKPAAPAAAAATPTDTPRGITPGTITQLVGAAADAERLSTPVPERTPTPTPIPPTATPTAAAATLPAATTPPKPEQPAAPADLSLASVSLLSPADGHTGHGALTFTWATDYALADNQAFEPVFWRAGADPLRDGRGYGGTTRGKSLTINWDQLNVAADGYQWGVLLVETDPYKRLHYMGGGYGFQFTGPDGSSGEGDAGGSSDSARP